MTVNSERVVKAGFEVFAKNIELSLSEYNTVCRCQAEIEAYLGEYITTFTTELPGAFARKTMVSPLEGSVVDMLVLFNEKHSSAFLPNDLLGRLHVTLLAKYPGTTFDELSESVFESLLFRSNFILLGSSEPFRASSQGIPLSKWCITISEW